MATYTPNLNLKKPSTGEYYDVVADNNDAKDKIDLAVGIHINVKLHGAKGNNINDDTLAIREAITKAIEIKESGAICTLFFPNCEGYIITDTLEIPEQINVVMDGIVFYSGPTDRPGLVIGTPLARNRHVNLKIKIRNTGSALWDNDNFIGAQIYNVHTSMIELARVEKFNINVQMIACNGEGVGHNIVNLGYLQGGKIQLDLTNNTAGWVNDNLFFKGNLIVGSANPTLQRWGVRITSQDGNYVNNSDNHFISPSFQLGATGLDIGIPIRIEHGRSNKFIGCRNEYNSQIFAEVLNTSHANEFESFNLSYNSNPQIHDTSTQEYRHKILNKVYLSDDITPIFISGNIAKRAAKDTAGTVSSPDVNFAIRSNSNPLSGSPNIDIINNDYLEFKSSSNGVGVIINTEKVKRFVVKPDFAQNHLVSGARIFIIPYDASGALLNGLSPVTPYVKGTTVKDFYWRDDYFNGSYRISSNIDQEVFFTVSDEVKSCWVIIANYSDTERLRLKGFGIYTMDGYASVDIGIADPFKGALRLASPPVTGPQRKGAIVLNSDPAPGSYLGWVCISDGIPGTWKGFGVIQA